ncbi:OmpA family protein [Denitromonas iodatirespirans]|uniref:OmpA family protein n=1 Tax=Denitromonas iodatirespirans TaxID=2795389 RepID=A0A944DA10_DENI1|nr:OmpA family protein [Denitromonas iodatirespirans]MBT0961176.1 OmpA family protein [Denitromonas iodatirespirans]
MKSSLITAALSALLLSACATTSEHAAAPSAAEPTRAASAVPEKTAMQLLAAELAGLKDLGLGVEMEGDSARVTLPGTMTFRSGRSELNAGANDALDKLAGALATVPQVHALIVGHTDSAGDNAYNQRLSEARAAAVGRALVERGVAEERLSSEGRGEDEPVADNATREGRAANRRVELMIGAN